MIAFAVGFGGGGDVSPYMNARFGVVDGQECLCYFRTDGFGNTVAQFPRYSRKYGLVANLVIETDFGVRNGSAQDDVENPCSFGGFAT